LGLKLQEFVITVPAGTGGRNPLTYSITGPDAADYYWSPLGIDPFNVLEPCPDIEGVTCTGAVGFSPQSIGPKSATLVVTDSLGNRVTAALKGVGVAALCLHTVVPCNYAHHYSGVVSWSGGDGQATVYVVMGEASCNVANPGEEGGLSSGPGLIGVEFDESDDGRFYRITVACPFRYPPDPARPAELGHGEFGSYKQPLGITIAQVQARPPRLMGSNNEGGDIVSWDLCPNSQYQWPSRSPGSLRQGRCPPP
jgi:hypothetical protein